MTSNLQVSQNPSSVHSKPPHKDMVWIPGRTFEMGSNSRKYPEEGPVSHRKREWLLDG